MNEIIQKVFQKTVRSLPSEFAVMPLSRWNESVLRYFFCRTLATEHREVEQFVECNHIDLVLRREARKAYIEFKFYMRQRRFDPVTLVACGFKGGPGKKNMKEFVRCIDFLHGRPSSEGLSKWIVLLYADPPPGRRARLTYAGQYDSFSHAHAWRVSTEQLPATEGTMWGHLYKIG